MVECGVEQTIYSSKFNDAVFRSVWRTTETSQRMYQDYESNDNAYGLRCHYDEQRLPQGHQLVRY